MKSPKFLQPKKEQERVFIVPTVYGFLYGGTIFILISLATIFNRSDLLIMCALFVTFGVVCMHQTHTNIVSLGIQEVDTQSAFAGEETPWRFKILNTGPTVSFSINILDEVLDIPARELALENISILGTKRGYFQLKEIKLSSTYPLGLFYAWKWAELDLSYYVYPALAGTGAVLAPFRDRKSELDSRDDFIGHREYVPGDSAHHIDWKVHARQQKLLIKQFESSHTEASVLDWKRIPGEDVEAKLSLLARAIFDCNRSQKPYGMILPDIHVPIGQGPGHYEKCLQILSIFGGPPLEKAA